MSILESFIPTAEILKRAVSLTRLASTRPDVPTAQELALSTEDQQKVRDLLVDTPDWQIAADGRPVAGLLHLEDFFRGFSSPSIPLLFALLPVLGVLTGFALHFGILTPLAVLLGLASVVVAGSLSFAMPAKSDAVEGWAVSFAAPLIMTRLLSGDITRAAARVLPADLLPGVLQWVGGMAVVGILVAVFLAVTCLWQAPRGHKLQMCESVSLTTTFFTVACIAAALLAYEGNGSSWIARHTLFPIALTIPWLAGVALGPWRYAYRYQRSLSLKLLHQGMTYGAGAQRTLRKSYEKIRAGKVAQIKAAVADTSPVFEFGVSTGTLAERGSQHGIPKGHPAYISAKTAQVHTMIYGKTGGGKSSSYLEPYCCDYMQQGVGGLLVLDGKFVNANRLRGTRGARGFFTVIDEHIDFAPFEGLGVDEICTALLDANAVRREGQGSGDFFVKSAIYLLTVASKLMFAMRDADREMIATIRNYSGETPPPQKWFITPDCLRRVAKALGDWREKAETPTGTAATYVEFIKANHPAFRERSGFVDDVLGRAMDLRRQDLNNVFQDVVSHGLLASETRTGVDANLAQWINPLFAAEDLLHWTTVESGGYQPERVCHGESCGLYLPPERFVGGSGLVYSNLVKGRITSVMKRRPNDWQQRDPTATKVAIVADEYHVMASPTDLEFSSKCRSWGGILVFATQTQDVLIDALGADTARALLSNFQTRIWFSNPNSLSTLEDAMETVGKGTVTHWAEPTRTLNLVRTARLAATSPIYDQNHPDHDRFSTVIRDGGGSFEVQKSDVKMHKQRHGQYEVGQLNAVVFSKVPTVENLVKKEGHWVTSEDWHDLLIMGRALVQSLRGGEKIHDFVDCKHLVDIPEELFDTANPQHPLHMKQAA
ncbi:TraM recognition domain-containing protein [Xanthomonas sp. NCPPB 2632]|uniref:TraM recognition domain-containing protein n=1 Tax=Xanthomonas sp. NCPPB 2632 TaxID=3240912 RepID=UPI003517CD01